VPYLRYISCHVQQRDKMVKGYIGIFDMTNRTGGNKNGTD